MFLLYFIVNLINYVFYLNLNFLNKFYLNFNKFNLIFKKSFEKITFFEKFILIIFYKSNWFFRSVSNFSDYSNNINILKKNNYPILNFFSLYNSMFSNKLENLFLLKKIYIFFNKNKFLNKSSFVDFILLNFILNKKYLNFLNSNFFENTSNNNLLKLNFIFFYFNKNSLNYYNYKFNLNYYNDWFNYTFSKFNHNYNKIHLNTHKLNIDKKNRIKYITEIIKIYNKNYNFYDKFFKKNYFYKNISLFSNQFFKKYNKTFFKKLNFNLKSIKFLINNLPIRFSESSINKYINSKNLVNYNFFYIRKNKIFNKGRYSRNRQLYRTGVYWCLWLNIMIVYGLYFFFYRFTFNFGYIWLGLCIIIFSTIFSRILKYKFYNVYYLYNEFYQLFIWLGFFFKNFVINFKIFLNSSFSSNNYNLIIFSESNFIVYNFYKIKSYFLKHLNKKKDYGYVYIWKNYSSLDKSFLKYKSVLNWFTQLYKVLVY